jgi:hypothetical protein
MYYTLLTMPKFEVKISKAPGAQKDAKRIVERPAEEQGAPSVSDPAEAPPVLEQAEAQRLFVEGVQEIHNKLQERLEENRRLSLAITTYQKNSREAKESLKKFEDLEQAILSHIGALDFSQQASLHKHILRALQEGVIITPSRERINVDECLYPSLSTLHAWYESWKKEMKLTFFERLTGGGHIGRLRKLCESDFAREAEESSLVCDRTDKLLREAIAQKNDSTNETLKMLSSLTENLTRLHTTYGSLLVVSPELTKTTEAFLRVFATLTSLAGLTSNTSLREASTNSIKTMRSLLKF